jgi:hypothetical protein
MALGAQDSKYILAIAFAVLRPDRSWSFQLLAAKIPGTKARQPNVIPIGSNFDFVIVFKQS